MRVAGAKPEANIADRRAGDVLKGLEKLRGPMEASSGGACAHGKPAIG
jgi:hypothetical protein